VEVEWRLWENFIDYFYCCRVCLRNARDVATENVIKLHCVLWNFLESLWQDIIWAIRYFFIVVFNFLGLFLAQRHVPLLKNGHFFTSSYKHTLEIVEKFTNYSVDGLIFVVVWGSCLLIVVVSDGDCVIARHYKPTKLDDELLEASEIQLVHFSFAHQFYVYVSHQTRYLCLVCKKGQTIVLHQLIQLYHC